LDKEREESRGKRWESMGFAPGLLRLWIRRKEAGSFS